MRLCGCEETPNIKRAVLDYFRAKNAYNENHDAQTEREFMEAEIVLRDLIATEEDS